jgi:arginyl-tRNA--protein-N-Asp/Glu arginylyltransferase
MEEQIINLNTVNIKSVGNCGYCEKKVNGKWTTTSFQCKQMKPEDYHTLINRGWRRCGTDYYKPNADECKQIHLLGCMQHRPYTIRLNVQNFQIRQN